ncbi:SsrA-binding protein SmpB [Alkalimarinus coralli]|uniref:SsrA-binding protein SmpB n=1 Tax=Alkalimarinus coralli TaxID=2935863 RepID=UPI00202B0C8F|nr:SsrA-binding protein SmpB [Alkalimarinus coralli]
MAKKKKSSLGSGTIAQNKKARHDYHIEEKFEAGLVLTGWEVKSLRAGKAQLTDAFVMIKNGEAWLHGTHFSPLTAASTHVVADPTRTRKLLLNKKQISKIATKINQTGRSCVALALYWSGNLVKCEIALVTGKKQHDKRASEKEKDWNREKQRTMQKSL